MKIYGLYCQKCNKEIKPNYQYADGQFYVCSECGRPIGYRCSGCERFFDSNHMIFYNNLYICKICGTPQYGYTNWKIKKRGEIVNLSP